MVGSRLIGPECGTDVSRVLSVRLTVVSFEVDGGSRRILDLFGVGRRAFGLVADTDTRFRPDGALLVEPLDIVIELCQPGIGQLLVRETRRVSVSSLGEHDCDLIAEVFPFLEQWRQGRLLVGARFEHATRVVNDRFEQVLGNSSHQKLLLKYRADLQSNAASTEL